MPINNCQYTLLVITSSFSDPEKILKTLREADFMLLEASNQQEAHSTNPYHLSGSDPIGYRQIGPAREYDLTGFQNQ